MAADDDEIYRSIKFNLDGVDYSKWPKLSCSAANELTLATPDDPNPGAARLAIDGALKLKTGVAVNQFSSDRTLGGNSDLTVPTEKAVKAYIDSQINQVNQSMSAKAGLAGVSSQDFQAKNLKVSGNLTTVGNVGIGTPSSEAKLEVTGGETKLQQQALQTPQFQNGWMNYDNSYNPVGYFKDSLGVVHLRGLVKGGSGLIFTLPSGYRPPYRELHAVITHPNVAGRIDITPDGQVLMIIGSAEWISLDGITFRIAEDLVVRIVQG
jgi:hypothetical protein